MNFSARADKINGEMCIRDRLYVVAQKVISQYGSVYPELLANQERILSELSLEEERFQKTIKQGLKEVEKLVTYLKEPVIPGKSAFRLYDTFGFPIEFTEELAAERGFQVDRQGYEEAFKQHQELSHAGAEQRFKGGLADTCLLYTSRCV